MYSACSVFLISAEEHKAVVRASCGETGGADGDGNGYEKSGGISREGKMQEESYGAEKLSSMNYPVTGINNFGSVISHSDIMDNLA